MKTSISKLQAISFMKDVRGTVYGNPNKECGGIMSTEHVAELMGITAEEASEFLWAAVRYELSDRQGGAFVI